MIEFTLTDKGTGLDFEKSNITFVLKFDDFSKTYYLKKPSDLLYRYVLERNGRILYSYCKDKQDNDIISYIQRINDETDLDYEFEPEPDEEETYVKLRGISKVKIPLSELTVFATMDYNLPPSSDSVILRVELNDQFLSKVDDKYVVNNQEYELLDVSFKRGMLPNFQPLKRILTFKEYNVYTQESENSEWSILISDRLNKMYIISPAFIENFDFSENLVPYQPTPTLLEIECLQFLHGPKLLEIKSESPYIILVTEKIKFLRLDE